MKTNDFTEKIKKEILGLFDDAIINNTAPVNFCDVVNKLLNQIELHSYRRGYNSGFVASKRLNPRKMAYFADNFEQFAKGLRLLEDKLKDGSFKD